MAPAKNPQLCEYCSAIDFELFRLPTEADLADAKKGKLPKRPPYHIPVDSFGSYLTWSLGPLSRVATSAASGCPLCASVNHFFSAKRPDTRAIFEIDTFGDDPHCKLTLFSGAGRFDAGRPCSIFTAGIAVDGPPSRPELLGPGLLVNPDNGYRAHAMDCFRVQEEAKGLSAKFSPMRFGSKPRPPQIDIDKLKEWVDVCCSEHGDTCGGTILKHARRASRIRLIDVTKRCLVEMETEDLETNPYVALSYVWGEAPQRMLLKNDKIKPTDYTLEQLKAPGSLASGKPALTIDQAIELTDLLGVKYIWVDALCIIQDDNGDKAEQLGNMSNIYADAVITIIAACGLDCEGGLSGLHTDRLLRQDEIPVLIANPGSAEDRGMTLLSMTKPRTGNMFRHALADTEWLTRGWTMQERALSRRAIMITDWMVYWSCGTLSRTEESGSDADMAPRLSLFALDESSFELGSKRRSFFAADNPGEQMWYKLKHLGEDYSRRLLRYQGDGHDAFAAVLTQFTSLTGEDFLWGVPVGRFGLGLCWDPLRQPLMRREERTTLPQTSLMRHVKFPSWSWMGWVGEVNLRLEDHLVEEGMSPQVNVSYVLRNSPLRLIPTSNIAQDDADKAAKPSVMRSLRQALRRSSLAVTLENVTDTFPGLTLDWLRINIPDDELVVFRAQKVTLRITEPIEVMTTLGARDEVRAQAALKSNDKRIRARYARRFRRDILGGPVDDKAADEGSGGPPQRKVIGTIASCWGPGEGGPLESDDHDDDEMRTADFVLVAINSAFPGADGWALALQVRDNGEGRGIMERVAIAEIEEAEWKAANPQMELIVLG